MLEKRFREGFVLNGLVVILFEISWSYNELRNWPFYLLQNQLILSQFYALSSKIIVRTLKVRLILSTSPLYAGERIIAALLPLFKRKKTRSFSRQTGNCENIEMGSLEERGTYDWWPVVTTELPNAVLQPFDAERSAKNGEIWNGRDHVGKKQAPTPSKRR